MHVRTIALALSLLSLAGCQTVDANSPEALKKAEIQRLKYETNRANCKLVVELNRQRTAQKKEQAKDNNCAAILMNSSSVNIHPVAFVPDFNINGIPLPIGALMKLAVVMERNDRENKAVEAKLPAWATKTEGADMTYRILLSLTFTQDEIATLKTSSDFADAAQKSDAILRFLKANPQMAKEYARGDI
ncbi:hypothetical protein [Rhizobium sp. FY34]|uniref:hypothetical protein n=1 Tax=Rhizobium sp. FY34 TaxID=2562309 RepID=UPI0010C0FDCD|nr:hypothetical protein [Rhizobium sp. FY34]